MSAGRGIALTTVLAVVLALLSAAFALRAIRHEPAPAARPGSFRPDDIGRARALIARLARGMLSMQRADGGFELGEDSEESYFIEAIAGSALASTALARIRELEPPLEVPGLDAALGRALDYVKKQQIETGAIGREEPKDRWSQVDATSAGLLALTLAARDEDEEARIAAAKTLKRFARGGLRNGWSRALGIMAVAQIDALGRGDLFDGNPRGLADIRDLKQVREGPIQTSDWNVAEGIARVVLGLRKGADPFPAKLVLGILDDPPEWDDLSGDCQSLWMQAWLVSRSGAMRSRDWFHDLLNAFEQEAIRDDDTIHGGYYAKTLVQTAGATLALIEGLMSQVVVVEGVGETPREHDGSGGADGKR